MGTGRPKNPSVIVNASRLDYLLKLFRLSRDQFVNIVNDNSNTIRKYSQEDLFTPDSKLKLNLLKKIDKIFQKGLSFYMDPRDLHVNEKSSIFFRKDSFNNELNLEDIRVVSQNEEKKFQIKGLCADGQFTIERTIKTYSLQDDEKELAAHFKDEFKSYSNSIDISKISDRDYLKLLISFVENHNVFVLEYTEAYRKKEKVSFSGFFLDPNVIVLKKQKYVKREIFTLMHEFAHYLLNKEDIDKNNHAQELTGLEVEDWCNSFAYHFIIGESHRTIEEINSCTSNNNFCREVLENISNKHHISTLSLYTQLKIRGILSSNNYKIIKDNIKESISKKEKEEKLKNKEKAERLKKEGKKIIIPQPEPIVSGLLKNVVRENYFEGNIDQLKACLILGIKEKNFEEAIYRD